MHSTSATGQSILEMPQKKRPRTDRSNEISTGEPGRVGFIGLGLMGFPMAGHLAAAGFEVTVFDIKRELCEKAHSQWSGFVAKSAAEVAETCNTVLTCLPSEEAVERVYFGDDGIGASGAMHATTIDCSTVSPRLAVQISNALGSLGVTHMEAAIIGPPPQAAAGQLYFVVSGNPHGIGSVERVIRPMARAWKYVGASGAASRVKLLQNALGYCTAVATAEVLTICHILGINCDSFIEVVNEADGIGGSTYFREYAFDMAHRRDGGSGRLKIAAKDMRLILELAAEAKLDVPALTEAGVVFSEALKHQWGNEEHTAIWRLVETRAGRKISG